MTQGDQTNKFTNKRLSSSKAIKILSIYLAPDGNFSEQLTVLKSKVDELAIRLQSPNLTPRDIKTYHKTIYTPAMQYILPRLAITKDDLQPVQSQVTISIQQKLRYSSKIPTGIRYGPEELGGLGLFDLHTELGISTLKYMCDAIYSHTEAGKLMILNVKYLQIESGISEALLEHPGISIPHPTPTWITSVWQFLYQHNLSTSLTDKIKIKLRGPYN
jgi:hypothetical protein